MQRGNLRITFNGEIYNFRALREELRQAGETLANETDTEVLLALFARHGASGCLERLRGMFSFAVWDERTRTCFLARDGFGIKPLYYGFSSGGDFIFASEVRALLSTGLIKRALDPGGLDSFLSTGSVAEPLTMFAGVRSLEAGHWLRWRDGELETGSYFQLPFDAQAARLEGAASWTRTALIDSVRHHFVSDVPVGIFLSGGMDSGALVALAREAGSADVATFSIGVEDAARDESQAARERAAHFGARHHEMLLTRELAGHWVGPFVEAMDQPTVDGFNTYCVSKLVADYGYKVALSGVGGDELFGGYPSFRQAPRLARLGRHLQPFRSVTANLAGRWERHARSGRTARLAGYFAGRPTLERAYEATRSIFSPWERIQLLEAVLGDVELTPPGLERRQIGDLGDEISRLELTRYLRNQLLRDADVMSMAHGVELRVPFLDREFMAAVLAIPAKIRLRPEKRLLQEAVPELIGTEVKRGFALPFDCWLNTSWSYLQQELRGAPQIPLDTWSRKWSLIVLSRWLRKNGFASWRK